MDFPSTARAAATHEERTTLLDLAHALLVDLLSSTHCSSRTAGSAAGSCQALRQAALESVTQCQWHCDVAGTSAEDVPPVLAFARSLPSLQRLRLTDLDSGATAPNLSALALLTHLQGLQLAAVSCDLVPQRHSEELSALAALTSLRRLSLSYYALDNRLMRALGAALPRVHTLLMERCTVAVRPSEGVDESSTLADTSLQMFDGLTRFTALAHLSLAACNLVVNSECGALLAMLTALTHFNLDGDSIYATGARSLGKLTALRSLSMCECAPHDPMDEVLGLEPDDGVTVALRALTALTALTKLELAEDKVEFMGAHAVARLTSLLSLTMDDCGVGADGARALAAGLTALTSLSLSFNTVREEGVCALFTIGAAAVPRVGLCLHRTQRHCARRALGPHGAHTPGRFFKQLGNRGRSRCGSQLARATAPQSQLQRRDRCRCRSTHLSDGSQAFGLERQSCERRCNVHCSQSSHALGP